MSDFYTVNSIKALVAMDENKIRPFVHDRVPYPLTNEELAVVKQMSFQDKRLWQMKEPLMIEERAAALLDRLDDEAYFDLDMDEYAYKRRSDEIKAFTDYCNRYQVAKWNG